MLKVNNKDAKNTALLGFSSSKLIKYLHYSNVLFNPILHLTNSVYETLQGNFKKLWMFS